MQDNQHSHQYQKKNIENQSIREAEVKKNIIPLDERMTMFSQLLREKQVQMDILFSFLLNVLLMRK